MPLGPDKLTNPGVLDAIKSCLVYDPTLPTRLRWADDYHSVKTTGGTPAGSLDSRNENYVVGVKKMPLHCRHVVWMLVNNKPIPHGYDVICADGNKRNLDPHNLALDVHNPRGWMTRPKVQRTQYPHAFTITRGIDSYLVTVHVGKDVQYIYVGLTPSQALKAAALAAHHFGYVPGMPDGIPVSDETDIRDACDSIFTVPLDPVDIKRYEAAKHLYITCLRNEMVRLTEEAKNQDKRAPDAQMSPAPVPAPPQPLPPALQRIIYGGENGQADS